MISRRSLELEEGQWRRDAAFLAGFTQLNLLCQLVDLLLAFPELIGPRIAERLVGARWCGEL